MAGLGSGGATPRERLTTMRASLKPGILLGIGLGGFVDRIVLHQILQWHHMVTAEGCCPATSVVGLEDNTLADGIFHAVTWMVTVIGSLAAVSAWRKGEVAPPWLAHFGALLIGWGILNLLDSSNHFIFGLHHIRDDLGGPVSWDIGFLMFAVLLMGVGAALSRSSKAAPR